ncbi:hypothetical protein [Methanobrevibacter sp.]|uniref:hypothetical protein n=1 Tax=Methanobrevibacter sp. TaxID=66852 RepID=UPI002E7755A3|nr:hypothetical protein [Methanobrevibacter sp.]MEE1336228.1 hypothetical protein [Methanobrevibacter sp.]
MIRRVTTSRRLLRKKMYRSPHSRHRISEYKRENKNLAKPHQEKFREMNGPNIKRKKRPKREVISGFKMSYRYKYYQQDNVDENEEEELDG